MSKRFLTIAWLAERFGGAHRYLYDLCLLMADHHWDVTAVVNRRRQTESFLQRLAALGVRVIALDTEGEVDCLSSKELDKVIARVRPSVVHVNSTAVPIQIVLLRSSQLCPRLIRTCLTMHLPPSDMSRVSFRSFLPFSHYWRARRRIRRFLELFHTVISVSTHNLKLLHSYFPLPSQRRIFVPNGVPEPVQCTTKENKAAGSIIIGSCANLVRQKRMDLLLLAAAKLPCNVIIRIAGDGPEGPALRQLSKRLGLEGRVEFLGLVQDIASFLRSLDVFVLSSDYEAFPYSLLEAMAAGLPCVATAVGDVPLIVRHGRDGFLFDPGDVGSLAALLSLLVQDTSLRNTVGGMAQASVCRRFAFDRWQEQTYSVFQELVASVGEPIGIG